mmetsp:Transcript_26035/g.23053  ORF Transcript_26035/g.23053 Transcript_26035/m.23053 type:complete len:84 (+) Transcript_26035:57-308(+)
MNKDDNQEILSSPQSKEIPKSTDLKEKNQIKSLIFASIAGACFAFSNYMTGNNARLGFLCREAIGSGVFLYGIIFVAVKYIQC